MESDRRFGTSPRDELLSFEKTDQSFPGGVDSPREEKEPVMTEHVLKCGPQYFDAVERGDKSFEVRRDDRGFQCGDVLILQRTCESMPYQVDRTLDGRVRKELRFRIAYILTGGQLGIELGYVVMSLEKI